MPIENPNPIMLATADEYWAVRLTVTERSIAATLVPYDPDSAHILGDASLAKNILRDRSDPTTNAVASALGQAMQAMAQKPTPPTRVSVNAPDPQGLVSLRAEFGGDVVEVDDLYSLLGHNQQAGGVYEQVLNFLSASVAKQIADAARISERQELARQNLERINARRIAAGKEPI